MEELLFQCHSILEKCRCFSCYIYLAGILYIPFDYLHFVRAFQYNIHSAVSSNPVVRVVGVFASITYRRHEFDFVLSAASK